MKQYPSDYNYESNMLSQFHRAFFITHVKKSQPSFIHNQASGFANNEGMRKRANEQVQEDSYKSYEPPQKWTNPEKESDKKKMEESINEIRKENKKQLKTPNLKDEDKAQYHGKD